MSFVRQELSIGYVYLQYGFKWLRRVFHVATTEMKGIGKGKGNVTLLQARCGPEGGYSYRYTLP
jgi:hypothetical protein